MPILYERDDQRRLIIATITEPYSVDDVLSVIDRQATEDTWQYAMLYDLRGATHLNTEAEAQQIADHVKVMSARGARGPVAMAISANPEQFRQGVKFAEVTRNIVTLEVLLTAAQVEDWMARNAQRRQL
jgi:hypothetical protein